MINLWHSLKRRLTADAGSISIEFVMMAPIMGWAFVSMLSYFDAYRTEALSIKAGLTIADVISRETQLVDDDYIDGLYGLHKFISLHDKSPGLRITSAYYHDKDDIYGTQDVAPHFHVAWSEVRGTSRLALTDATLAPFKPKLPIMANESQVILVETWTDFEPVGTEAVGIVGLQPREMPTFTFIEPRHIKVCFNNTPSDLTKELCGP